MQSDTRQPYSDDSSRNVQLSAGSGVSCRTECMRTAGRWLHTSILIRAKSTTTLFVADYGELQRQWDLCCRLRKQAT
ncbi:hypothetical protein MPTK1_2g06180 [Marchantia polymorpha subsp. ruderalis]|uniref:Uncharacterized protein n=1 Tax=Marchantia polymorpha TaxID=3197 RepID=A0A2R6XDN6_MARPO|nr:hypothetical protein MARPO_0021s0073 [Marchantia polymorpha]BBN01289.1 hypothetical protein Mp_2g06180 [Marchantia polymorpha subsp. ruderalis]|eukprot:PTQ44214.1 hypothetical protein MARPO_0021s0073 [Marchantia polymorpha]